MRPPDGLATAASDLTIAGHGPDTAYRPVAAVRGAGRREEAAR